MKYVFVDLEMQPIDHKYKAERAISLAEIIEIGAVMLDESFEEVSTFKKYVKPEYSDHISRKIYELTGITDRYLSGCKSVKEELEAFAEWCLSFNDEITVYTWSDCDLKQIRKEYLLKALTYSDALTTVIDNMVDLQHEYDLAAGAQNHTGLSKALESVGIYFTGKMHDAIDDAYNTAEIFKAMSDRESFEREVAMINSYREPHQANSGSGTTLGDLLDFSMFVFDV